MTKSRQADPDAVFFGAVLRRERLARGWTIVKLARRAGMNSQYVGVVEAGRNSPTLATILELAEVLGADAGRHGPRSGSGAEEAEGPADARVAR